MLILRHKKDPFICYSSNTYGNTTIQFPNSSSKYITGQALTTVILLSQIRFVSSNERL